MSSEINFSKWSSVLDPFLTKLTEELEEAIYFEDEDTPIEYSHLYQSNKEESHFEIRLMAPQGEWEEITYEKIVNLTVAYFDFCKNSEAEFPLFEKLIKKMMRLENFQPYWNNHTNIKERIQQVSDAFQKQQKTKAIVNELSVQVEKELSVETTSLNANSWLRTFYRISSLDRSALDQLMSDQILSKTQSCLAFTSQPTVILNDLDNLLFEFSKSDRNEKYCQSILSLLEQVSRMALKRDLDLYAISHQQDQKEAYKQKLIAPVNTISYADTATTSNSSKVTHEAANNNASIQNDTQPRPQPSPQEVESAIKAYEDMLRVYNQMQKNHAEIQERISYLEILQEGLPEKTNTTGAWYLNNELISFKEKHREVGGYLDDFESLNFLKAYPNLVLLDKKIKDCLSIVENKGINIASIEYVGRQLVSNFLNSMQAYYQRFNTEFISYGTESKFHLLLSEALNQNLLACDQLFQTNLSVDVSKANFHDLRIQIRKAMVLLIERFEKQPKDGNVARSIVELSTLLKKCYFIAREFKRTYIWKNQSISQKLERTLRTYLLPFTNVDEIWKYLRNTNETKNSQELEEVTQELLKIISPEKHLVTEEEIRDCFRAWNLANHPDKNDQADYKKKGEVWALVYAIWKKRNELIG